MAHAAVPLPKKSSIPLPVRRTAEVRSRVLPFHASSVSKHEAAKLFQKFADRAGQPVGKLRAELIPDSSWKRADKMLRPTAAQTVSRLERALAFATRTWHKEDDAIDWLLGPHLELGGATPFSMLRTESGGRAVEYVMAALEYGFPV